MSREEVEDMVGIEESARKKKEEKKNKRDGG